VKPWSDSRWNREFKRRMRAHEYVALYIIGPPSAQAIKIGYAAQPKSRLAELQIAHWSDLELHFAAFCFGKSFAQAIEACVHQELSRLGKHIRGEWFSASVEEARQLIEETAQRIGARLVAEERVSAGFRIKAERELSKALEL
jgi:hypothetical protein